MHVVETMLDEEAEFVEMIEKTIEKNVRFQVEPSYSVAHFDVVLV
jgi:hypothetical protein